MITLHYITQEDITLHYVALYCIADANAHTHTPSTSIDVNLRAAAPAADPGKKKGHDLADLYSV